MKLRFVLASLAFAITCPSLHGQGTPNPDWTIYGPTPVNGQTLTISASWSTAGAIMSLKLGDVEFVDNADHGRQIQSAIQLNGIDPSYNPNEAGSIDDGSVFCSTCTTSELLGLAIPSSNRLMTTTDMAYFFVKSSGLLTPEQQDHTIPPSNAPHDGQLTQFWTQKDVTIGPPGLPGNVIEYLCSFQPSATTPPEPVTSSIASSAGVYLKYPDFSQAWTYDLATRTLLQHHDANGSDDMIKIMIRPSSPLGPLALSAYAPEHLQPYGVSAANFGWWLDGSSAWPSTFLNPSHYASGPLPVSYRTYLVVGNPGEVMSSLDSLGLKFSSQDPDVFQWREYIRLNGLDPATTEAQAQGDWLNNGIAAGRAASYHFALGRYRDLNSDQWGKTNQAVIDHYIQYGRKEGRSTVPRADGGYQHTLVRSPKQDFVPVLTSGSNANGQLGDGTTNGTASPVRLPNFGTGQRPTDVSAGAYTSLAVLADGTVWMWGSNANGARGDGSLGGQNNSPVQVPYLPAIVVPSTKDRHVVAVGNSAYAVVDNTGRVWTWGYGGNGQLGNGSENSRFTPGVVQKDPIYGGGDLTDIVSIAIGDGDFMVALDIDEHVWTWGYNGDGELGNNTNTNSSTAVKAVTYDGVTVTPLAGIVQVAAGGSFCVALDRSGEVLAWGKDDTGQLGDYGTASRNHGGYVQIPTEAKPIDKIAVGMYHALAHAHGNGKIYVWGYNGWGQIGLLGVTIQRNPTPMPEYDGTTNITDVAAGGFYSLLIRANAGEQKVFGLGDNQSGQLGVGNYTQQNSPVLTGF